MKTELAERYYKDLGEWDKTLGFYQDEIRVFEKSLKTITKANTGKEVLAKVEHFQNQFILQKEQFAILHHDIRAEKTKVRSEILEKGPVINVMPTKTNHVVKERIESAEKIFRDTKKEFNRFLSETL